MDERYDEPKMTEPGMTNNRPDLEHHMKDHMCATSMPGLTNPDDKDSERGELPPMGEPLRMDAKEPWKPMGRKD